MRSSILFSLATALLVAGCSRAPEARHYELKGQIIGIATDRTQANIKHGDIPGLMPAMTMPYRVKETKMLDGIVPGDLVTATLVVESNDAYLSDLKKVGSAPLAEAPEAPPSAAPALARLKTGDAVPDAHFVDQDGRKVDFSTFKGKTVVLTFIYTSCPLPTFCPLMDRHFATLQGKFRNDPALKNRVHLVTISFDPTTDTPPVLKKHAEDLHADFKTWTFLTGNRDDIDQFGSYFGLVVTRAENDPRDVTHTLRTAIVDADGKLVKVYTGNEWTPEQVLADLKPVATPTH